MQQIMGTKDLRRKMVAMTNGVTRAMATRNYVQTDQDKET